MAQGMTHGYLFTNIGGQGKSDELIQPVLWLQ
jgi:hypothetical protein